MAKYVSLHLPGHVLAPPLGRVYAHRLVLFDLIGLGPHQCWWCGISINWRLGLTVDHLDNDGLNNDPENLVASCQPCNSRRRDHAAPNVCGHGHFLTERTIVINDGRPRCLLCRQAGARRSYQRKLERAKKWVEIK